MDEELRVPQNYFSEKYFSSKTLLHGVMYLVVVVVAAEAAASVVLCCCYHNNKLLLLLLQHYFTSEVTVCTLIQRPQLGLTMNTEHLWNYRPKGKKNRNAGRETCLCHFVHKFHMDCPGLLR
jgi:hypothetical protein